MKKPVFRKYALLLALLSGSALYLGGAGVAGAAHAPVPLLDANGQTVKMDAVTNVGPAYSAAQTCGACHDYNSIEQHSYHSLLDSDALVGFDAYNPNHSKNPYLRGVATKGKPWVQGSGHAGKW